tara:strand:- start:59169 stop:61523 length:2355 start_codon:yes stop_codon:yes gene_type:complete
MQIQRLFLFLIATTLVFAGCEVPKKPDFQTSQKVEAPILYNKTYQFMGGSNALIDTTSTDLDSLFVVDGTNNFITISKEQDFEFGDLNDAVPVVSVDPTSFESQVGEIEVTDFSSDGSGNLGEASFEDLTGIPQSTVNQGDNVPNQTVSPEVTIDLNTDLFESATFKDGALNIVLQNNLGFNLDDINVTLVSSPTGGSESDVADGSSGTINDGEQTTISIPFTGCEANPSSCQLANPAVRVSIEWTGTGQTFQREPESLVVVSAVGDNLTASQVQAALDEQDFSTTSLATFGDEEFEFTSPDHFVLLKSGRILVSPIQNEMEFRIRLEIEFSDIRECPASLVGNDFVIDNDPLTIEYAGEQRIRRAENGEPGLSPEANVSLANCKLYATNNEVAYTINAFTENTKDNAPGDQIRVINETQSISSDVEISNLQIKEATGIVRQQVVLLNDEDADDVDENLDLFNDNEAELTEIDGLEDLSSQLDGLNFTNPRLSINYTSNITVPTTIYGAFVGVNGQGEQRFLRGLPGGPYDVQANDPISGLQIRGQDLLPEQMIKFTLDAPANAGEQIEATLEFNRDNTSVVNFLNNLPSEIRFIGKAVVNEDEEETTITDSLSFVPKIAIDIPLAFSTSEAATFSDTTENDLGDLPSSEKGDDTFIKKGLVVIDYENGLPLGIDLEITFLDADNNPIATIPQSSEERLGILASGINDNTRFANDPTTGKTQISLSESQIQSLYKTKFLKVSASLVTTDNSGDGSGDNVRIRTTDFITLSVKTELFIETQVGGN